GRFVARRLGLPASTPLRRYQPGQPLLAGPALVGGAPGGRLREPVAQVLRAAGAEVRPAAGALSAADAGSGDTGGGGEAGGGDRFGAVVFDAAGIASSPDLHELYAFLHPVIRPV